LPEVIKMLSDFFFFFLNGTHAASKKKFSNTKSSIRNFKQDGWQSGVKLWNFFRCTEKKNLWYYIKK